MNAIRERRENIKYKRLNEGFNIIYLSADVNIFHYNMMVFHRHFTIIHKIN